MLVNGGVEVQLYQNNQLRKHWHPSQLRDVLPPWLTKWIEDHQIHMGPQPYPQIKQLWQYLTPLASKKLIIDASNLAELKEVSQPADFELVWKLNTPSVCIEGHYKGVDRYLGMGWFQKGITIWSLKNNPSSAIDAQLKNLIVPVQQANFLLSSIIPNLQPYLSTRADFQVITDFTVQVTAPDARSGRLTLALECNYPQLLSSISAPQQNFDVLLTNQAIIRFPHQALTPVLVQLLQHGPSITIQGTNIPLFISEQLPVMRRFYQISDDMVAKVMLSHSIQPGTKAPAKSIPSINASVLSESEEINQPQDFALVWELNCVSECIEGRYEGADRYLGMGRFQKGTTIWSLKNNPSSAIDAQLKNLIVPIQQINLLLNSIIPDLQQYLPIRADFQVITDFAVQVVVRDARIGKLVLALECNYPQLPPTIQIPQQKDNFLLAKQAIIRFPRQALTPVLTQLFQSDSLLIIQGTSVPLFIREQLPVMYQHSQLSDASVAEIRESNPIISIDTLKPTYSMVDTYENGIGKYSITTHYEYQQHTLDMGTLLAAYQLRQRFVQQYAAWFEWPDNADDLANTIQRQQVPQVLWPAEVMGFDTRRIALLKNQLLAIAIQPDGMTPLERGQSVFKQLRHHGIPGGIVGDPTGLVAMFVNACEDLFRDSPQARILWLTPSYKKGMVTRAIHGSTIRENVIVASLVALNDETALFSHSWTLVIFQELDILLDGSPQSKILSQLKWQWALTSVTWTLTSLTPKQAVGPLIMQALHLPEQYHEQFCTRYLFDPLLSYKSAAIGQSTSDLNTAQSVPPVTSKNNEASHSTISRASTPIQPASVLTPNQEEQARSDVLPSPAPATQTPRTAHPNPEGKPKPEQLLQTKASTPVKPTPASSASMFSKLEAISQPSNFALVWELNRASRRIEGRFEGADLYLGGGRFQQGTKTWLLKNYPTSAIDSQLKKLTVPLHQTKLLLNSMIPYLQQYLPTRADFQFISNFAVRVVVRDARSGELVLALECNYPQLLPDIQIPEQQGDVLLAKQAIIHFSYRELTPVLAQLLQSGSPLTIQGPDVPQFISEQLPIMLQYGQISDDMAERISQSNPIVSIASLKPIPSYIHTSENGIGKYNIAASYAYQQQTLDMEALLTAYEQKQRFIQQHGIWFEWPTNAQSHVNAIREQREPQVLLPEEVMGFDTQITDLLAKKLVIPTIQPIGTTPVERSQSIFEQLRHQGIPGIIVGRAGMEKMFVHACEYLLCDNEQARILWLTSSSRKDSVLSALHTATLRSYVTVAPIVALYEKSALLSRLWTLVIFQDLDMLLDGSLPSQMLSRLNWQWALASVPSREALRLSTIQVLNIPEKYHQQFCDRFLFDLGVIHPTVAKPDPEITLKSEQPLQPSASIPAKSVSDSLKYEPTPSSTHHGIELDQEKIVKLHEESEHLQERLTVEDEEPANSLSLSVSLVPPVQSDPVMKRVPEQSLKAQSAEAVEQIHKEPATTPRENSLSPVNVQPGEKDRQIEAAAATSLSEKKAEQIAYAGHASLIKRRVAVMKKYWHVFDEIHARQAEGMKPLRAGQILNPLSVGFEHPFPLQLPDLYPRYQQLLPADLLAEIDQLWGTILLPRWPERIVSEPFPHELFLETFGVALNFWHSCALNAWFFCEDTLYTTRMTNLSELEKFYHKEIQVLKDMGTPINRRLFEDLGKAGMQLSQPQGRGVRRKGFEKLRDVISSYRQQWANAYLDKYLQKQWQAEIHEVALSYSFFTSDKGAPPTINQFAKEAKEVANHWFGGDISRVYEAIKEQSPLRPQRVATLPLDKVAFALIVVKEFDVQKDHPSKAKSAQTSQQLSQAEELVKNQFYYRLDRFSPLNKLAEFSFWYVQLEEALGYPPTLSNFGSSKFSKYSELLSSNVEKAWDIFTRSIKAAKQALHAPGIAHEPAKVATEPPKSTPEATKKSARMLPEYKKLLEERRQESAKAAPELTNFVDNLIRKNLEKVLDGAKTTSSTPQEPTKVVPKGVESTPVPMSPTAVSLDLEAISKLQADSEHLHERLVFKNEAELSGAMPEAGEDEPESPASPSEREEVPATPVVTTSSESAPAVDEDWQLIFPQWKPEHWEVITLLYQGRADQLAGVGRQAGRPVSRLIDEINSPVDDQLGDLLVDPDAQTLAPHLLETAGELIHWYLSSKGR